MIGRIRNSLFTHCLTGAPQHLGGATTLRRVTLVTDMPELAEACGDERADRRSARPFRPDPSRLGQRRRDQSQADPSGAPMIEVSSVCTSVCILDVRR